MQALVLGTGSSGNSVLVDADGTRVLLDAGLGPRALVRRLEALGHRLEPGRLDAVIATHHHGDHIGGAEKIARAFGCAVYLHPGVDAPRLRSRLPIVAMPVGSSFRIGGLELLAEPVPHDAPQVALRVASSTHAFGLATDIGRVVAPLARLLASCDVALVEANHCTEMLSTGPYPAHLRARVSGGLGHLSNAQAAALASKLVGSRLARMYLGHLSRSNNTETRALETVAEAARGIDVDVLAHGAVARLDVRRGRAVQLTLPLG